MGEGDGNPLQYSCWETSMDRGGWRAIVHWHKGEKVVTYLGSLVWSCCGEGETLQTNIPGVCGECSQYLGHTGFATTHRVCAFPVFTAQAPGCSAEELSKMGHGFRALPRSKLFMFRFLGTAQRCRLSWTFFCAFPKSQKLRWPGAWWTLPKWGGASYHLPHPSRWVFSRSAISGVPCRERFFSPLFGKILEINLAT